MRILKFGGEAALSVAIVVSVLLFLLWKYILVVGIILLLMLIYTHNAKPRECKCESCKRINAHHTFYHKGVHK